MSLKFTQLKPTTLGLDSVLDFGRHFGYTVSEILKDWPEYIQWLAIEGKKFYPSVLEQLQYFLEEKQNKRVYTRSSAWNDILSDQDDWWDDVPF